MKTLLSIAVLFLLGACTLYKSVPVKSIIKNFEDEDGGIMIVAHRANLIDSLPENSLEAVLACIQHQIDIVEIDIQKTKDGVLIVMHDERVDRMTNGKGVIKDMNWSEIEPLYLRQKSFGSITSYKVPTLAAVFAAAKGKIMINVDKAFWYLEDVHKLADEMGVSRQIIVKSYEEKPKIDQQLGDSPNVQFMPIIVEGNFDNRFIIPGYFDKQNYYTPEAMELIFETMDDSIAQKSFMQSMDANGCRIWVNALSDKQCGGYADSKNAQENWTFLIQQGVNIIQTDRGIALKAFLDSTQMFTKE